MDDEWQTKSGYGSSPGVMQWKWLQSHEALFEQELIACTGFDFRHPNLGQAFLGSVVSDRIALECHAGQQRFVDEIQVNEQRYIVRTKNPGSETVVETVLVLEEGGWKIALLGR